jgi:hypothetical protein
LPDDVAAMPKLEDKDFKSRIAFALARQFRGMWAMTRQAVEQIPDKDWTLGAKCDPKWFYSLRVYHIIETAEFYARNTPDRMQWGARLGKLNWWETITHQEAAELVVKGDMLVYIDDIAKIIESNLKAVSDSNLLQMDGFHWFSSILEKYQYLIRHNTYHLGELTMQLRDHNHDRIKWV